MGPNEINELPEGMKLEDGQLVIDDVDAYLAGDARRMGHEFTRDKPRDEDHCLRCGCSFSAGDMMFECRGRMGPHGKEVG